VTLLLLIALNLIVWWMICPRLLVAAAMWFGAGVVYAALALVVVAIGALAGVYP
jgi:hypothetical protein